jgi:alanine dehydrogenase
MDIKKSTVFSYLPLEETLEIGPKKQSLFIGIPKEDSFPEKRVPLTPAAVQILISNGHRVYIESKCGDSAFYFDHDYSEAGAKICYQKSEVFEADMILKTAPLCNEELILTKPHQTIIGPLHLPTLNSEFILKMMDKKIVVINIGSIKDDAGYYPIVRSMSEICGSYAVQIAAQYLSNNYGGHGLLLGAVAGTPPINMVIIGAGTVAETAARCARGLGANIKVFDNNIYKLSRLQRHLGFQCYTSVIDPNVLIEELKTADVLIGAIKPKNGITPMVVTEEMVSQMKPGSVIVDVSIDNGGCVETSEITTHENPVFLKHDILHYCVPNMASGVARTASNSISNVLMPLLMECSKMGGVENMIYYREGFRNGVFIYKGLLTSSSLAKKFDLKYSDITLLLANYQ